ncbi:hypothetical protein GCM10009118_15710 [Wandonia haliotis]|uniref:Uncharacterized protein n=1 Tax=Wandonia haliotis TaxID=574963 RepID=A0ABN1MQ28_9FLAO
MEYLFYTVLIIVPAGIVFGTAYFFMKKLAEKEQRSIALELRKERQKHVLPGRIDAYQRLVLLMERISPNSLVMRIHNPGMPARQLQGELLKTIREEFEHNVAQQIFISPKAWDVVKNSKEEIIKIINMAGNQMDATATATDLAQKIFEISSEITPLPTEVAAHYLKEELQQLF